MVFELHIWGPAFGVPSIDAECLAAITYLRHCLPAGEWVLVASSDISVSPTKELPALRSGSTRISRFRNIVDYLKQYSAGEWDLDRDLDLLQRADCTAFSAFLESRGQPLLDLSLYVSTENYTTCTRSAFADILTWPNQWITPTKLRAAAKQRSSHLGLSSLDVDAAKEERGVKDNMTAQIPKSLLKKPKETVSGLLGKSTQRTQFRLDAVTAEFLEPVSEMLGSKRWFVSEHICTLDCMALGYLTLMQTPALAHPWLQQTLKVKFSNLYKWTEAFSRESFGPTVTATEVLSEVLSEGVGGKGGGRSLPWQAPLRPTLSAMSAAILENMLDSVPIIGQVRATSLLRQASQDPELDDFESRQLALSARNRNRELYSQIVVVGAGIGTFVGYLFWVGLLRLPLKGKRKGNGRRDFGVGGAMLGL